MLDYPHGLSAKWCGSYQVVNELFQAGGLLSAVRPVLPGLIIIQSPAGALRSSAFTSSELDTCREEFRSERVAGAKHLQGC